MSVHIRVGLTVTILPHIMRLRSFVKQLTRSTRAGRLLGGPVSTKHWGLKGGDVEQFSAELLQTPAPLRNDIVSETHSLFLLLT